MIQVGDKAPEFSATTQEGATIRLADFVGKRNLVLFFYPKDGSPACTKEACSFRDSYEQFANAETEVVGVSSDSTESHRGFAERHRLPFRLISDPKGELCKAFGVPKVLGDWERYTSKSIDLDRSCNDKSKGHSKGVSSDARTALR